jgi:NAD-dependent deacetylase
VKPNAAHFILAELEDHFEVQIITQNVDDLHERAGSTKVPPAWRAFKKFEAP